MLCYLATVVGNNEISNDKNEGELLAISIAMAMQRYNTGRISQ
jgi:hypothetical protein